MKSLKIIIASFCVAIICVGIFNACQKEDLKQLKSNVDVQNEQFQKGYYEPDIDTVYHGGTICYVDCSTFPCTTYYMWGWEAITHSVFNYVVGSELTFATDEEPSCSDPRIRFSVNTTGYPGIKGELTTEVFLTNYEIVYENINPDENDHFLQMTVEFLNQN
jgi:hypothetical protein